VKAQPLIMVVIGVFTAGCAMGDFDWFMNNYRARFLVSLFGRDGARMVYGLLGAAFIVFGVVLFQRQL